MRPIVEQIEAKLPWLFSEGGFRIVSHSFNPARYDNSIAVLQSGAFRLRFVRDKGLVAADVAALSEPERWYNLTFFWEAVFGERPEPTLEGYGPLIRRGHDDLAEALGAKLSTSKMLLDQHAAERQRRINEFYASRASLLDRVRRTRIGRIATNPLSFVILFILLWIYWGVRGRG